MLCLADLVENVLRLAFLFRVKRILDALNNYDQGWIE